MLWAVGLDGERRVADGDASLWRLEGKLRNEKRSLEARSNSFSTLSFPLVSPACPPPPLSPPQCCPLLTLLKATGPIQILYHLEYYSLWDSKRKCGGFTCLSTVSSGWGYVFFLCFFFSLYASRIQRGGVRVQCMSILYISVLSINKKKHVCIAKSRKNCVLHAAWQKLPNPNHRVVVVEQI